MASVTSTQDEAVTANDFPEVRWHGHWTWCEPLAPSSPFATHEGQSKLDEAHALFRKVFTLDSIPARVPARITADSRYLLFANGREVHRGPIRSQPKRSFYDMFDLAPYLVPGENTLAVYVKFYGTPKAFWQPAPPTRSGLGRTGIWVFEANLGEEWLVSDDNWKALKSNAWAEDWRVNTRIFFLDESIPVEIFDARQFPFGWEQPGFDDLAWGSASKIVTRSMGGQGLSQPPSEPYGPLYPRPIARLGGDLLAPVSARVQMLEAGVDTSVGDPVRRLEASPNQAARQAAQDTSFPIIVTISGTESARITLDMGRIVMGQVQFRLDAPAGTVVDLSYTEDPLAPPKGGFGGMHSGTRYYARGENDQFAVYDALGFRYANILIHSMTGPVRLHSFTVQEDVYPWAPGAEFKCSDEELNKIFKAGIRTVQLNARDAFTDCPTREQQAWVGDSVVHQMVSLVTNTDWRLAWQYLTLSDSPRNDGILPMTVVGPSEASGGMTIPDWSLHWVHGVYNLYRFLGDREMLLRYMPSVARVLRWFEPYQTGAGALKDIPEWPLIDWSAVSVSDTSAIYTAIWARGLREFAEMAGWLGEKASAAWAEKLYAKAKTGFEMFWDEARGSYIDHLVDGLQQPEMSQLAGALGIVSGLAPKERWQRIINTITDPTRVIIYTWQMSEGGPFAKRKFTWDVNNQVVLAEPFMSYVVHDAVAEAGLADRLPVLYRRWSQFLQSGYDTIGEDWKHGTHVHGWSTTPTKDMVFYTLGVTPAEPGYSAARIRPALGDLEWAEGRVPSPFGLISVRVEPDKVIVDSPVPVIVQLPGKSEVRLSAGKHTIE